ncbi:MAG: NADPH-dependent F420 reductase [Acidobacteriota bacterium]
MKFAVLGMGNVGAALGARWAREGHSVVFGVRNPSADKVAQKVKALGRDARAASVEEACMGAEIVVLAVPWGAVKDVLKTAGGLEGKILVDCTNPIADGFSGLSVGFDTSAGEEVAAMAPGARVVKAFNTTGSKNMANPILGEDRATMFICGDDARAKEVVADLADQLGFDACDTGPLYHARYLEPMAMLWVDMAYRQGVGPDFAFKILRR